MSITVRALTLTLMLFLQLFWGPLPPETALPSPNLATKDLRDLLSKYKFIVKSQRTAKFSGTNCTVENNHCIDSLLVNY
jgi:hypothetical protein